MRDFSIYLDRFPSSHGEIEVERKELEDFSFPVNLEILENKGNGLAPIKRNGRDFFNVRELIGYARMHSIPNLGFVSRKQIRAAEILGTETIQDAGTGEEWIKTVFVACAFMRTDAKRQGQVVFICPFCGCIHYHGCGGEKFGDGDGDRQPHCHYDIPAFYRLNSQKYGLMLDAHWHFHLVETEDFTRAGAFPKTIAKNIVNRYAGKS